MLQWAIRAALFDSRVYAEIGDDPQSVLRALGIVLVAAIAFALGIRDLAFEGFEGSQAALFLVAMMTVFLSWVAWAAIGYLVGTRIMGGQATYRRMLRALGVAHGPGVLAGFVGTPFVGGTMFALSLLWLLAAGFVAVRESEGFGAGRAFLAAGLGWFVGRLVLPAFVFQPV